MSKRFSHRRRIALISILAPFVVCLAAQTLPLRALFRLSADYSIAEILTQLSLSDELLIYRTDPNMIAAIVAPRIAPAIT